MVLNVWSKNISIQSDILCNDPPQVTFKYFSSILLKCWLYKKSYNDDAYIMSLTIFVLIILCWHSQQIMQGLARPMFGFNLFVWIQCFFTAGHRECNWNRKCNHWLSLLSDLSIKISHNYCPIPSPRSIGCNF